MPATPYSRRRPRPARRPRSPPGEPLFGNARQFARDPFRYLDGVAAAYPDGVLHLSGAFGPGVYLVLNPALVRRVLVDDAAGYVKPHLRPELTDPLLGEGLLTSEGDLWRRQRVALGPALFGRRLEAYAPVVTEEAAALTATWADGDEVDLFGELTTLTVRVISRLLFDVDLPDEDVATVCEAMRVVGETLAVRPGGVLRPPWLPASTPTRYDRAVSRLHRVADRIVAENRIGSGDDDLLSLVRAATAAEPGGFPETELRDEVLTFLLAGHETTSLLLTYTLFLLSDAPESTAAVRAEVDAVVGGGGAGATGTEGTARARPTWEHLPALTATDRALWESMRLLPPVWSLFREPRSERRLGDYRVPVGAPLFLPQWALHRSPRHWDDPLAFRPERWVGRTPGDTPAYFPFGLGPRACIGRALSLVEAKLVLAHLLGAFEIDVPSETLPRYAGITMQPTGSVPAVVTRRS